MTREEVREIVRETVDELRRKGLLRIRDEGQAYGDIAEVLKRYYETGEGSEALIQALGEIRDDQYGDVIPLYYSYGYTIDKISEAYGVEVSTVVRNKKRLCMEIWRRIQ